MTTQTSSSEPTGVNTVDPTSDLREAIYQLLPAPNGGGITVADIVYELRRDAAPTCDCLTVTRDIVREHLAGLKVEGLCYSTRVGHQTLWHRPERTADVAVALGNAGHVITWWVATRRRGTEYHTPAPCPEPMCGDPWCRQVTLCGRSMRTGELLDATTLDDLGATPCGRCAALGPAAS
jgi:hypothetical protein